MCTTGLSGEARNPGVYMKSPGFFFRSTLPGSRTNLPARLPTWCWGSLGRGVKPSRAHRLLGEGWGSIWLGDAWPESLSCNRAWMPPRGSTTWVPRSEPAPSSAQEARPGQAALFLRCSTLQEGRSSPVALRTSIINCSKEREIKQCRVGRWGLGAGDCDGNLMRSQRSEKEQAGRGAAGVTRGGSLRHPIP